jgi:hypothetical protein
MQIAQVLGVVCHVIFDAGYFVADLQNFHKVALEQVGQLFHIGVDDDFATVAQNK